MLRRYKNKSSHRLNRRKSTSSVQAEPIDPAQARQHAQAAATYAYLRAQERNSTDIVRDSRDGLLSRHNSTAAMSYRGDSGSGGGIIASQGSEVGEGRDSRFLRRQQSVRFVGPNAVKSQRSYGGGFSVKPQPQALSNDTAVPAAYRPPSRSSSIGRGSLRRVNRDMNANTMDTEGVITALLAADEYYTREDDVASTPSSYRRMPLQRSKSLSSQLQGSQVLYNNGTPHAAGSEMDEQNTYSHARGQGSADLRGTKSMSFLRGGQDHLTPGLRQDHDTAVQMARDKFLHQIEQQRLREQPSFLFRARARRQEKPFRKTVRSANATAEDGLSASDTQLLEVKKGVSFREKARKASLSLRKKIKGLFRKSAAADDQDQDQAKLIPDQQGEARISGESSDVEILEIPGHDHVSSAHVGDLLVSRVSSRVPSLRAVPSNQKLRSRSGSVSSLRSNVSSKSRVTSWTSSAIDSNSTLTSRHLQAERERQRLSIIQENGTHVPSSSFRQPSLRLNQSSAYPMMNQPRNSLAPPPIAPVTIDSQMVYTALMRRFDENNMNANLNQRKGSAEDLCRRSQFPPRSSSLNSQRSSQGTSTPATIRHVRYGEGDDINPAFDQSAREEDDVFSPESVSEADLSRGRDRTCRRSSSTSTVIVGGSRIPSQTMQVTQTSAGQELAPRNAPTPPRAKGLRETPSLFFGTSTITPAPRTTSPYRRALAAATNQKLQLPPPIIYASSFQQSASSLVEPAYTESVYSRTTSGRTSAPPGTVESPPLVVESPFVLLESQPVHQDATTSGPSTWNSQTSSHIVDAEGPETEPNPELDDDHPFGASTPKSSHRSHVQELTQILPSKEDYENSKPSFKPHLASLGTDPPHQENTNPSTVPKLILKKKPSVSLLQPPPAPSIPAAPPIPVRSPLRTMPSVNSMRYSVSVNDGPAVGARMLDKTPDSAPTPLVGRNRMGSNSNSTGRQVLHKRSTSTLRTADTPAKLSTSKKMLGSISAKGKGKLRKGVPVPVHVVHPSPGIMREVEKQFGSVGSRIANLDTIGYGSENDENRNPNMGTVVAAGAAVLGVDVDVDAEGVQFGFPYELEAEAEIYDAYEKDIEGAGLLGPYVQGQRQLQERQQGQIQTLGPQAMGSQRMVDLFLSSRRRRIVGKRSLSGGASSSEDSGGMFI